MQRSSYSRTSTLLVAVNDGFEVRVSFRLERNFQTAADWQFLLKQSCCSGIDVLEFLDIVGKTALGYTVPLQGSSPSAVPKNIIHVSAQQGRLCDEARNNSVQQVLAIMFQRLNFPKTRTVCFLLLFASVPTAVDAQESEGGVFELTPVNFDGGVDPWHVFNRRANIQQTGFQSDSDPVSTNKSGVLFFSQTVLPNTPTVMPAAADDKTGWSELKLPLADMSGQTPTNQLNPVSTLTIPVVTQTAAISPDGTTQTSSVPGTLTAEADTPKRLSAAMIDERRKLVEAGEFPDDVKAAAILQYQQAVDMLRRADEAAKRSAELRTERDQGPELLAVIRATLAKPTEDAEPKVADEATVSELDKLRLANEDSLRESRKALEAWEQRSKIRTERKPQMAALIEKTKQQLVDARKLQQAAVPDGEAAVATDARRTEQEAFIILLQNQLDLYETERSRYDALNELFPLQRDQLTRNRNVLEKRSEAWKTVLAEAGRRETARQAAEARRNLQNAHPDLRELAEGNSQLIEQRKTLQSLLSKTRARLDTIGKTFDRVSSDFKNVKDKEDRAGLTTAIGILLRNQRGHLPDDSEYIEDRVHAESQMSVLQLEQLPLEDERDDLVDTSAEAEKIANSLEGVATDHGVDLSEMTLSLLNDRKKYLDDLLTDYESCIRELAELDVRSRKLLDTTQEYRNYIDERVLWIRSAAFVNPATPRSALSGIFDLVNPERWQMVIRTLTADLMQFPFLSAILAVGLVLLLVARRRLRNAITALAEKTRARTLMDSLTITGALALNLLVASVWPLVVWLLGRRLMAGGAGEFGIAIGESLKATAIVFWSIEVFREICRPGGIAARHLNWPERSVSSLHNRLVSLMTFGIPLVFAVAVTENWNDGVWADSLGRLMFVLGMCLLTVSFRQIMKPKGRVLNDVLQRHKDGWFYRTRKIWYAVAITVPLLLAGMAIAGYQYTAEQLLFRVQMTFWLLVVLVIAFSMCVQWLISTRKQLAMEQAKARRAAALARHGTPVAVSDAVPMPKVEEPKTDFLLLSDQMLKLVRATACVLFLSGSWFIWGEVLPALQVFNRVELWTTTVQVAEDIEDADGQTEKRMVTKPKAITLGSLFLAVGLLGLSMVASRNIPGLLELAILQRLPLDHGGRNAITTLCRYALTLVGVLLASQTMGIGWSSVQWLLAALTLGLGFGLQEIFANFVSGLIILFERPVRIGDVVTIDGVSGSVSRIQIRATTITDFDRKEYIVPNKEFVTGRVLNWTLSDQTNRIRITVGVAYGTDTEMARGLLVQAACEHPLVLKDPAPVATFEEFGDSCLNLQLRCFLPSLENRLTTLTELHEAIDRVFKANKLEIAFPQRDIHVRSMTALPVAIQPALVQETVVEDDREERKAA